MVPTKLPKINLGIEKEFCVGNNLKTNYCCIAISLEGNRVFNLIEEILYRKSSFETICLQKRFLISHTTKLIIYKCIYNYEK